MSNETAGAVILIFIIGYMAFRYGFKEGYKRKKEGTFFKFSKTDKILGIIALLLFLFLAIFYWLI